MFIHTGDRDDKVSICPWLPPYLVVGAGRTLSAESIGLVSLDRLKKSAVTNHAIPSLQGQSAPVAKIMSPERAALSILQRTKLV